MNKLIQACVAFLLCLATTGFAVASPQDAAARAAQATSPMVMGGASSPRAQLFTVAYQPNTRGVSVDAAAAESRSAEAAGGADRSKDSPLTLLAGLALIGVIAVRRMSS